MTGFCTTCGTPRTAASRFCTGCGTDLGAAGGTTPLGPAPAPPQAAPPPPWASQPPAAPPWAVQPGVPAVRRSGGGCRRILVILGVVLLGIIVLAVGGGLLLTQGPRAAVDAEMALFAKGDLTAAYAETAPALKRVASQADFEKIVRAYPVLMKGTYQWSSASVNGDEAIVKGVGTAADGSKADLEFNLTKVGDTWRVMGFGVTPIKP